jgi:hypothetical protein
MEDLWVEQAVCREALRLSLQHHRSLAVGLGGAATERGIANVFRQSAERYELVDMMKLNIVIGSGGVLSHAPSRMQAALMMIDGFGLEGVTQLAVDSIFMLPHLGVFASVYPEAAQEIFLRDCLVHVGIAVVPRYPTRIKRGTVLAELLFEGEKCGAVVAGEVRVDTVPTHRSGVLHVKPTQAQIDVGAGPGQVHEQRVQGGDCGVILDGRNRPFQAESFSVHEQATIYRNIGLIR